MFFRNTLLALSSGHFSILLETIDFVYNKIHNIFKRLEVVFSVE